MTTRRLLWLTAIALLVIGAALWLSAQRQLPHATLAGAQVLPGLAASLNEVRQIRIARGDGSLVTLRRLDNGEWQVVERGYRADVAKLRRLLLDAAALAVVEEKTRDPANYAALGVDEPNRPDALGTLLEIQDARQTQRLIVGRGSGLKAGFVRVSQQAGSLLVTPQLSLDVQPAAWLDHQLFDLPAERIKSVTRRPAPRLARNAPAPADPSLVGFTIDDVRSAAAPAGPQVVQLNIETRDGLVLELSGTRDGTRNYVALAARALEGAESKVHREASDLAARTAGRQFEIPGYRYDSLFPGAASAPAAPAPGLRLPSAPGAAAPR